jgi:hypothetical protein
MKNVRLLDEASRAWMRLILLLLLLRPLVAGAALEQTFDVLQVGTTTYRNVTVTTKDKNYVFIIHSQGMTNIKVADLSSDLREKLGYVDPAARVKTNTPAIWARQTLTKLETPQVTQLGTQVSGWLHPNPASLKAQLAQIAPRLLLIIAGAVLALFLFHSFCCKLICEKAGSEPGPLIWIPILQLLPLLKAANMSPWWFLGFLVPVVNLAAQVLWCIKISQARGKSIVVGLLLIFPLTSLFALLYLAFSDGRGGKKENRRVEIMTLETA